MNEYFNSTFIHVIRIYSLCFSSIRFVDLDQPTTKTRLQPPPSLQKSKRKKRQTTASGDKDSADLFLSGLTLGGKTVISAIDEFDRKSSVQEKTSANFAILQGHQVADCSDQFGTFSSALKRNGDAERQSAVAEIRPENQRYHDLYNGQPAIKSCNVIIITLYLIVLLVR